MEKDKKEAALNENAGADDVAIAPALLRWCDIMDEEAATPKENLLAAISDSAEAITVGIVSANRPKRKVAAGTEEAFSYISSTPLSQEMDPVTLLMAEEED